MRKLPQRGMRTAKAKKLSPKQRVIAKAAKPYKSITGADFAALRKKKAKLRSRKR